MVLIELCMCLIAATSMGSYKAVSDSIYQKPELPTGSVEVGMAELHNHSSSDNTYELGS